MHGSGDKHVELHTAVWTGLDKLARRHGLSASALAKRGGLDPTSFNMSKRVSPDGKRRWPSTESIARVLVSVGDTFTDFVGLMGMPTTSPTGAQVPLVSVHNGGAIDENGNVTGDVDHIQFGATLPNGQTGPLIGIEISGDDYAPVYEDGTILMIALKVDYRRGDRVVVRTKDGSLVIGVVQRMTATRMELKPMSGRDAETITADQISWIARIVWASQ